LDVIYLLNRATTLSSGNTPLVVDLYNYMAERFKGYSPIVVDASRITPYTPNPTDNGCVPHTPDLTALWTVSNSHDCWSFRDWYQTSEVSINMEIKERIWKGITTKQKLVGSVALLVFLVFVVNPFYTVDEGERVVVKTFGEVSSIAEPGLNFAWPIVNSLTYYDIRTQTYDADCASASKDLQTVHTKYQCY